jgi:hypothetical protein
MFYVAIFMRGVEKIKLVKARFIIWGVVGIRLLRLMIDFLLEFK